MAATSFAMPKRALTWLISGCSSGLGLTLARAAQRGGQTVIATSRNPSRTPELVAEIEAKGGKWVALDVTSVDAGKVIDDLEAAGTHIDVLVNNAGITIHPTVETATETEVSALTETNYLGPARLMRAVVPHMRKRRFGVIANISTAGSLLSQPSMAYYSAAKAAMNALSNVLANEVASFNIRVLTVVPGGINTEMFSNFTVGEKPFPEDYNGTPADAMVKALTSGTFLPNSDREKAMKILYEVIMGEGVGVGNEKERILPLGRDAVARMEALKEFYAHAVEVFGDAAKSIQLDGR